MTDRIKAASAAGADVSVDSQEPEAADIDKNEKPVDKTNTDDARKARTDAVRMAKALEAAQAKLKELEEFKVKAEREKMTAEERVRAEAEDLKKEREKLQREVAAKTAELSQAKLTNKLLAGGLEDADFGEFVLKEYDEEAEDFDTFVSRMKTDKKFKRFFRPPDDERRRDAAEDIEAPASPASSSGRAGNRVHEANAADKAWAEQTYPNNPAMQKKALSNLAKARKVRAAEGDY